MARSKKSAPPPAPEPPAPAVAALIESVNHVLDAGVASPDLRVGSGLKRKHDEVVSPGDKHLPTFGSGAD